MVGWLDLEAKHHYFSMICEQFQIHCIVLGSWVKEVFQLQQPGLMAALWNLIKKMTKNKKINNLQEGDH